MRKDRPDSRPSVDVRPPGGGVGVGLAGRPAPSPGRVGPQVLVVVVRPLGLRLTLGAPSVGGLLLALAALGLRRLTILLCRWLSVGLPTRSGDRYRGPTPRSDREVRPGSVSTRLNRVPIIGLSNHCDRNRVNPHRSPTGTHHTCVFPSGRKTPISRFPPSDYRSVLGIRCSGP